MEDKKNLVDIFMMINAKSRILIIERQKELERINKRWLDIWIFEREKGQDK